MPLTDDQKAALLKLATADPREVADAMKKEDGGAPEHYQAIYQRGFSTAHNQAKTAVEAKETELTGLRDQLREKEEALTQVQTGDVKKLNDRITALETSNQKLTAERDDAKKSGAERVKGVHKRKAQSDFGAMLIELGIDADYAREVLVPKHGSRLDVELAEKDGQETTLVRAFDDDGVTPLQGAEPLRTLAEKVKRSVDPKWIRSGADKGGGTQNGAGAGRGSADKWDRIRQDVKATGQSAADQKTIQERKEKLLGTTN